LLKTNKSISILLIAASILIMALFLTACTPAQPAPQFTIRFGVVETQIALPYFIITEKELGKKYGLNFVETKFQNGDLIIEAMKNDSIDMSISIASTSVIAAVDQGVAPSKVVALAASGVYTPQHPVVAVLVQSSVSKWQDLDGQNIAVNAIKSINAAAIMGRFEQEGVHNYKFVEMAAANMGLAVAGGNVAAAVLVEPYLTQSLLRKDGWLLDWIIGGPPLENGVFSVVLSSTSFYKNYPQSVKNYLKAHLEAVKWIENNSSDARAILARRLILSQDVGEKLNLMQWKTDGRIDPILFEKMQPLLIKVGMLKTTVPANQLYNETLLNEVLSEKR
jgi:NitT/TauT family transport system substrate-binding protein